MSSDSTSPIITVIPLATTLQPVPYITTPVISLIEDNITHKKKTLIFYSRRGNARAWICRDCGYFEKCPNCDIAYAYHTDPTERLICHQCSMIAPCPAECPHCHGHHLVAVGVGIQQIQSGLEKMLPGKSIYRIDSDSREKVATIFHQIEIHDVILATSMADLLLHPDIGSVVFLLFEVNLSIPEYDMEEQLASQFSYIKKQGIPITIQTYTPDHPLLDMIVFGNQKSYLESLTAERKQFSYPPFSDFVHIIVQHTDKERVKTTIQQIMNTLEGIGDATTFVAYDTDLFDKRAGEWNQKIIIKGTATRDMVAALETMIIRNRGIYVQWK